MLALEDELGVRHVLVGLGCVGFGELWVSVKRDTHIPTKPRKLKHILLKLYLPI